VRCLLAILIIMCQYSMLVCSFEFNKMSVIKCKIYDRITSLTLTLKPKHNPKRNLGRYTLRNADCRNLKRCILRNFTCGTFSKLHLRFIPQSAFCKIQIKSNNQLRVGLGFHLSLKSTSAHHKWRGHTVDKVFTYGRLQLTLKTP